MLRKTPSTPNKINQDPICSQLSHSQMRIKGIIISDANGVASQFSDGSWLVTINPQG